MLGVELCCGSIDTFIVIDGVGFGIQKTNHFFSLFDYYDNLRTVLQKEMGKSASKST